MTVMWTILGVIGYILLILLGLLVLGMVAVLFMPLGYEGGVKKVGNPSGLSGWVKGSWLLRSVTFAYAYDDQKPEEEQQLSVKILGLDFSGRLKGLFEAEAETVEVVEEVTKVTKVTTSSEKVVVADGGTEKGEGSKVKIKGKEDELEGMKEPSAPKKPEEPRAPEEPREPQEPREPRVIGDKKPKFKLISLWHQFKAYPNKEEIWQLTLNLLKKLARSLKPKTFKLEGVIGLDDPSHTAMVLGLANWLHVKTKENVKITGNFTENVVELEGHIKGKLILYKLLFPVVVYYFKKPIQTLKKDIERRNQSNE